ncbi:hypothetical protein O181_073289 [Austropuccinia psidii MF-1]|uniref:Uncharacterized protein n=1 Tax=Austropuccinia psidii MF-1 TaxID=1389203 RepID=A0A9Q3ICB1_9BASI|nr:hypothetical protein [Austropuccinia psidii MF-1]
MMQTLEEIVRRVCAYGLELKDCDGFTHDWCTLLPSLKLEYETVIHASTNKTPYILEKGWNPRLPHDYLRKYFVVINPIAASFKGIKGKVRKQEVKQVEDSFQYPKNWHKSHATPEFKVGDLIL